LRAGGVRGFGQCSCRAPKLAVVKDLTLRAGGVRGFGQSPCRAPEARHRAGLRVARGHARRLRPALVPRTKARCRKRPQLRAVMLISCGQRPCRAPELALVRIFALRSGQVHQLRLCGLCRAPPPPAAAWRAKPAAPAACRERRQPGHSLFSRRSCARRLPTTETRTRVREQRAAAKRKTCPAPRLRSRRGIELT